MQACSFCDRKKRLDRFPTRLVLTSKAQAERKLGAHCKKCAVRAAHLRANGYMRPHAQDLIKAYHTVCSSHPRRLLQYLHIVMTLSV